MHVPLTVFSRSIFSSPTFPQTSPNTVFTFYTFFWVSTLSLPPGLLDTHQSSCLLSALFSVQSYSSQTSHCASFKKKKKSREQIFPGPTADLIVSLHHQPVGPYKEMIQRASERCLADDLLQCLLLRLISGV